MGSLHGGLIAMIIEDMMAITRYTLTKDTIFSTANLVVDYFKSVKESDAIIIITKEQKFRRIFC